MGKILSVAIDGDKLRREIKKRGVSLAEASGEIGRDDSYLKKVTTSGRITKPTIKMLERMFNIRLEEIQRAEIIPEPEQQEEPISGQMSFSLPSRLTDQDLQRLWKVIYTASRDGYFAAHKQIKAEEGMTKEADK